MAADLHDRPYYGKQTQDEARWVRGEARDGTTHFYRVATAYVMLHGLRVTLAIHFVMPADDMVMVLRVLLIRLRRRAITIACLFLDKGFAGSAVMRYLTQRRQPALIACPIRGNQGGTRAVCRAQGLSHGLHV